MKFKVGDKVRCLMRQGNALEKGKIYKVIEIFSIGDEVYLSFDGKGWGEGWLEERFELVEQPEPKDTPQDTPQVGDVWGSEDKQHIIKIIATFNAYDGEKCYSYLVLKSNRVSKDSASFLPLRFFAEVFPLLLHRPPKKQPKPRPEQPKKQEEVWERIFQSNEDYRCGNKIKVIYQGYEGLAVCNKHDKFDLMFGVNLAAHRAMVKYHQNVIAEMIKEEQK